MDVYKGVVFMDATFLLSLFHFKAVDFNIFEGMEVHGVPVVVISQGRVVVENGKVDVVRGSGRFIPRKPWSDYVYSRVFQRDKVGVPLSAQPPLSLSLSFSLSLLFS